MSQFLELPVNARQWNGTKNGWEDAVVRHLFNTAAITTVKDREAAGCYITTNEAIDISEGFTGYYEVPLPYEHVRELILRTSRDVQRGTSHEQA